MLIVADNSRTTLLALVLAIMIVLSSLAANAAEQDTGGYIYKGDKYIGEIDTDDVGDLARAVQNPIADLISVPFQNNTNFEFGPRENTQNVLNIQPVVPVDLNDDWMMITRTIIPVPRPGTGSTSTTASCSW